MQLIDRIRNAAIEIGMQDPEKREFLELSERIINDARPDLNFAYLFAHPSDDEEALFQAAEELRRNSLAQTFLIYGGTELPAFPGYSKWAMALGQRVGPENIGQVPTDNPDKVDTRKESQSLVRYAIERGLSKLYLVAPQFHQLRAFMTSSSEAMRNGTSPAFFNYLGKELPWDVEVFHSQGIERNTRAGFIRSELERIRRYRGMGHIASNREIMDYMDRRRLPQ